MPSSSRSPWIVPLPPKSAGHATAEARWRLFCFPYAGGASGIYRGWSELLPAGIEVFAVELPGRASRFREAPCESVAEAVAGAGPALLPLLDRPFALFGHSLGALVAFELARWLRREGGPQPRRLFASARRAPHLPDDKEPMTGLPEEEFLARLRELNGTPEEALQHPELMKMLLPTLRADFEMVESYQVAPEAPLAFPLSAWGGLADPEISRAHLEAWRVYSSSPFSLRMFPGDHFYINHRREALLQAIAQDLAADGFGF